LNTASVRPTHANAPSVYATAYKGRIAPPQTALRRVGERDGGIEVAAADRTEGEDERDKCRASGECVREERDSGVARRQSLSHDAGAYDRREEQGRPCSFGGEAMRERRFQPR
jgi:hypothetical protein